jgi:autotransporter-associated beta strand protein
MKLSIPRVGNSKKIKRALLAAAVAATLSNAGGVFANVFVWNGGGFNSNWNTGSNWGGTGSTNPGTAPNSAVTDDLQFAGSTRTTPNVNAHSPWILNSITFNAGASSFTIGGNQIEFNGATSALNQNSTNNQTINNDIDFNVATAFGGTGTGTVTLGGTLSDNGNITDNYAGTFIFTDGTNSLSGSITLNAGTLTMGANNVLGTSSIKIAGGVLNTGAAFTDTISAFSISSGSLNGGGTITAPTYGLTGGTINAKLGAGAITVSTGTVTLGASGRFNSTATLNVQSGALNIFSGGSETVASYTQSGGILNVAGSTLTAATYALSGGTINAKLGTGTVTVTGGTTILNGTEAANTVNINSGTLQMGANGLLAAGATVTVAGGTLDTTASNFNQNVTALNMSSGVLNGGGTLAASTYGLTGGTVNAKLGTGAITVNTGTVTLGSAGRFNTSSTLNVLGGALVLAGAEQVSSYSQSGGQLNGVGNTLTSPTYAFAGGTVNANLGTGVVTATSGVTTLNGNTAAGTVNVNGGTLNVTGTLVSPVITVANTATFGAIPAGGSLSATSMNLNAGSNFTMVDGGIDTLNLSGGLTIGGATGNPASLTFDLGTTAGSADLINVTGATTVNAKGGTIAVNAIGSIPAGSYTVITAPSGLNVGSLTLASPTYTDATGTIYNLSLASSTSTSEIISVTVATPANAYWAGGASSTWNTLNTGEITNWRKTAAGNVDTRQIPGSNTNVFFSTTTPAPANLSNTLGQDFSIASLTFTAGAAAVTIGGSNNLTIGSGGITNLSANAQTVNTASLTLGAAQTYNAGTVAGGSLTIGTLGSSTLSNSGFLLTVNGTNNTTINSAISGAGGLTYSGSGALALNGANSYGGATNVSSGTVNVIGSLGSTAITVATSATLAVKPSSGTLSAASLNLNAGSNFTMADGNIDIFNLTGGLTIGGATGSAAALTFDLGNAVGVADKIAASAGATVNTRGGTIAINALGSSLATGNYTLITASGGLNVAGLTLASSTFTDAGGTNYALSLANSTSTSEILSVAVATPTNAYWAGLASSTWNSLSGNVTNWRTNAAGNIDTRQIPGATTSVFFTTTNPVPANLSNTLGQDFSIAGLTFTAGSGAVTIGGANNLTIGAGGITNLSANAQTINTTSLTLGAAQTYNAGAVAGGSLNIGTLGSTTLANGGFLLTVNGANNTTISSAISGGGALTYSGTGTLTLNGLSGYTGGTTLSSGRIVAANTQALGNAAGTLHLNGGTLDLATDTSIAAYPTIIAGTPVTIVSDRATSGAAITHTLGTLNIAADQLNVTTDATVTSGTAGLTFGATTLSANGAVFDTAAATNLTLGSLSGNFSFTKQDSGQMVLASASARTGGQVTLAGGTMILGSTSALGTATVPLQLNGGTLDLATDTSVNAYNTTVGGTPVTIVSDRATSGAGITHTLGTLSIASDQLNLTTDATVTSGVAGLTFGATTMTGNPVFDTAASTLLTLGSLNDGGTARTITKQDSGTLTLNTAATSLVSGTVINITGGTANSNNNLALGTLANVGVANGAVFNIGASQTIGALSDTGSTVVNGASVKLNGNALTIGNPLNNLSSTFSGVISDGTGSGSINKNGTGTLSLAGNSTFSGGTNIQSGTIRLATNNALPTATTVTFGADGVSGILDLNGSNQQVGGLAIASGLPNNGAVAGTVTAYTGTQAVATTTVLFTTLPSGLSVGQAVMSPNLNLGTTIQSINGNTVVLQNNDPAANPAADWNGGGTPPIAATFNFGAWTATPSSQIIGNSSTTSNAALTFTSSGTSTFGGSIRNTIGAGNKTTTINVTSGTLVLNGTASNTYSGGTNISGGALVAGAALGANPLGTGVVTLSGGSLALHAQGTQSTAALTGFNQDVIAEVGAGSGTNYGTSAPFDGTTDGSVFYAAGFRGYSQGLPTSGAFVSAVNPSVNFQLASYTANNTLLLNKLPTGSTPTGTLSLATPARFSSLNFLTTASAGTSNLGFTLNFSDGTTESGNLTSPDWAQTGTTGAAIYGVGRFTRSSGAYDPTWSPYIGLYEFDYNILTADQGKTLNSISFVDNGGQNTPSFVGIFALSGGKVVTTASQSYANAVTLTGDANIDIANELTATVGPLTIGSNKLSLTSSDISHGAYNLTTGTAVLLGNPIFDVANNTGIGTLILGSLTDGGSPRTITKQNAGVLTLNTAATSLVNGTAVNVTAGTLNSNNTTALGTLAAVSVADNAIFNVGASQTIGSLADFGTPSLKNASVTLNANTLTVGNAANNLSSTFSGVISGTGNIVKASSGTFTLAGVNTYSGTTTVNAGRLVLSGSLGNTAISVNSAATFQPLVGTSAGSTGAGALGSTLSLNSGGIFDMASDNAIGTFNLTQQTSFAGTGLTISGATLNFDFSTAGTDLLADSKTAAVSGTNIIGITALGSTLPTAGPYYLITAASGLTGTFHFSNGLTTEPLVVGSTRYDLTLTDTNTYVAINCVPDVSPAITLSAGGATRVMIGSTPTVTGVVTNPSGISNYVIPANGITSIGSSAVNSINPNSGTVVPNGSLNYNGTINAVGLTAGTTYNYQTQSTDGGSPAQIAQSNVLALTAVLPSAGSLNVVSGSTNFGTVIVGATVPGVTFNLSDAAGIRSGLQVNGVTASGSASTLTGGPSYTYIVAPGATGTPNYVFAANTSTPGVYSATQTFTSGDDQSILGANPLNQNLSLTLTGIVVGHSNGSAAVTAGNNFNAFVNTPVTGTVTLSNTGTNIANLQVGNGTNNTPTITSGSITPSTPGPTQIGPNGSNGYTTNITTGAAGAYTNQVNFTAGDQQSLPGASPLGTISTTISGNVYNHAQGSFPGGTLTLPTVRFGYTGPVTSNGITVTNIANTPGGALLTTGVTSLTDVTINNVNNVAAGGGTAPLTATLSPGRGVGQFSEVDTLTYADASNYLGASSNLGTASVTIVGDVVLGSNGAATVTAGNNFNAFVNTPLTGTVTLTNSGSGVATLQVGNGTNNTPTIAVGTITPTSPGPAYIAANGSANYAAAFTPTTAGLGYTNAVNFTAGDDQSILGAAPLGTISTSITGNVYNHAAGSIATGSLTIPTVIVGYGSAVTSNSLAITNTAANPGGDLQTTGATGLANVSLNNVNNIAAGGGTAPLTATLAPGRGIGTFTETDTITYADASSYAGASSNLGTTSVVISGDVVGHANPGYSVVSGSTNFGTVIVGATVAPLVFDVTNAGSSLAGLQVQSVAGSGSASTLTGGPAFSYVVPDNSSSSPDYSLAINTGTAGAYSTTQTFTTGDDQSIAGHNALSANLPVTVTGIVLGHSSPSVSPNPVNLGIVHIGDTVTAATTLSNGSGNLAGLQIISLGGLTDSGSGLIAAGTGRSISTAINTSTAGAISNTYVVQTSDDTTIAGHTTNANLNVVVNGQVNYYAQPNFVKTGGSGTLSSVGVVNSTVNPLQYTLDFGSVNAGTGIYTSNLNILNNLLSTYEDQLGGSYTVSGVTHFGLSGFNSFSGINPGSSQTGLQVSFDSGSLTVGNYADVLTLHPVSSNSSSTSSLPDILLKIDGSITATNHTVVLTDTPSQTVTVDGPDSTADGEYNPGPPQQVLRTFNLTSAQIQGGSIVGVKISINFDKLDAPPSNDPNYPYPDLYSDGIALLAGTHFALTSPDGRTIDLIAADSLARIGTPFSGTITFDATATNVLNRSTVLVDGASYLPNDPNNTLSYFNEPAVAGNWNLTVADALTNEPLNYYGATLSLTIGPPSNTGGGSIPEPASFGTLAVGSVILLTRRPARRSRFSKEEIRS